MSELQFKIFWLKQRRKFHILWIFPNTQIHTETVLNESSAVSHSKCFYVFSKSTLQFLSLLNRKRTWKQHKLLESTTIKYKNQLSQKVLLLFFSKILCLNWQTANHLLCKGAGESVMCFLFCLLSMKHSHVHRQMTESEQHVQLNQVYFFTHALFLTFAFHIFLSFYWCNRFVTRSSQTFFIFLYCFIFVFDLSCTQTDVSLKINILIIILNCSPLYFSMWKHSNNSLYQLQLKLVYNLW